MESASDNSRTLVIIPCHNEEQTIASTIFHIKQCLGPCDVWVIDNCSKDDTSSIAKSCGAKVIAEPTKGKGFAVRAGFSKINKNYDVIFLIDGDNTYSASSFNEAKNFIIDDGYDMVVGTRIMNLKDRKDSIFPRGHIFGNKFLSFIFRTLFKINITDSLSGWRVMSLPFVKSFTGGESGFEIEGELNVHAYSIGAPTTEVYVEYRERPLGSISKLNTIKDGIRILKSQLRLYTSERPLVSYTFISSPWILLSLFLTGRALIGYLHTHLVEHFPSLIVGAALFIVGVLLITAGIIIEKVSIISSSVKRSLYSKYAELDLN